MGSRQYAKHRSRYYTSGTGNEFTVAMENILNDYTGQVQKIAADEFNVIAKECVQRLKESSPKNSGEYARAWHLKKRQTIKGVADFVVYNDVYMLTHLLEYGHEMRNGKRSPAHEHIAPVERWANAQVVQRIEQALK